jgi:hypothetical protein
VALAPCHLSHAADARDGGIATAVAGLLAAQQAAGLSPSWLTADRLPHPPPRQRDRSLSAAEPVAMGTAGRALVAEQFSWQAVAEQIRELYAWMIHGGQPPSFVECPP